MPSNVSEVFTTEIDKLKHIAELFGSTLRNDEGELSITRTNETQQSKVVVALNPTDGNITVFTGSPSNDLFYHEFVFEGIVAFRCLFAGKDGRTANAVVFENGDGKHIEISANAQDRKDFY